MYIYTQNAVQCITKCKTVTSGKGNRATTTRLSLLIRVRTCARRAHTAPKQSECLHTKRASARAHVSAQLPPTLLLLLRDAQEMLLCVAGAQRLRSAVHDAAFVCRLVDARMYLGRDFVSFATISGRRWQTGVRWGGAAEGRQTQKTMRHARNTVQWVTNAYNALLK